MERLHHHSVILCTRNRPQEARAVLDLVVNCDPAPHEIIVVDSSDLDKAMPEGGIGGHVRVLHTEPGLTRQRNIGLAQLDAQAEIVHFLDDDVEIAKDYFAVLDGVFRANPAASGVGVRTTDNVDFIPSLWRCFFLLDSRRSGAMLKSGVNVGFRDSHGTYEVDWLPGCAMSYRLTLTRGLIFDEGRGGVGWGEDVDFSLHASGRGPLLITCDTEVTHYRSPLNRDADELRLSAERRSSRLLAENFPARVSRTGIVWAAIGTEALSSSKALLAETRDLGRFGGRAIRQVARVAIGALVLLSSPVRGLRSHRRMWQSVEGGNQHVGGGSPIETRSGPVDPPFEYTSVVLEGGLGNQLFGFAVGWAQSSRLGTKLRLDTSLYTLDNPRSFELDYLIGESVHTGISVPRERAFREASFAYDARIESIGRGTSLRGYFQSWKYFDTVSDEVRQAILGPAHQSSAAPEEHNRFIAVQVRRGDYLNPDTKEFHGICHFDYFERGVSIVRALIGDVEIVVFSDDIGAARSLAAHLSNARPDEPTLGETARATLLRMHRAVGFVISNSSFGWWGAWLGDSSAPVVAPRPWLSDRQIDTRDLLPANWVTLDRNP